MAKLLYRYKKLLNESLPQYVYLQLYPRRFLTSVSEGTKEEADILSYVKKDHEYKISPSSAAKQLEKIFGIKRREASDIVTNHKNLSKVPAKLLSDNYKLCREHNVQDDVIFACPCILGERNLLEQINILQQTGGDLNVIIPLVNVKAVALNSYITGDSAALLNRIDFFSKLLKISAFHVCELMAKRQFLFTLKLDRIDAISKILFESGVTNEDIRKDIWVLRYSEHIVKERVEYAKSQKVDKIKTWMIRGSLDIFNKYIQRKSDMKSVLGDHSLSEYFSQKLQCTIEEANDLIEKHPTLKGRSLVKLQEIFDYLYSEGFKPAHIIRSPKIFFCSKETIKKRLTQLEGHKLEVDSLHFLVKSKKQYAEYIEAVVKNRTRKRAAVALKS